MLSNCNLFSFIFHWSLDLRSSIACCVVTRWLTNYWLISCWLITSWLVNHFFFLVNATSSTAFLRITLSYLFLRACWTDLRFLPSTLVLLRTLLLTLKLLRFLLLRCRRLALDIDRCVLLLLGLSLLHSLSLFLLALSRAFFL